ncbi:MAG: Rne/Rng family ribonuclease, partial [Alsobacter sp.]
MALRRRYKIQEVIRRRQVMLVQVVKEERGNKGAALTTYISLAGRYSVLMPNTAQGGGISRKIANAADRKRLKSIMVDLDLPGSMGAIVRTAGLERTKIEIKRDFDYLTRLWDEIREKTLSSSAPAQIYEDSDLVKRAIRDIYSREIDEILVDGAEGYGHARAFMKMLMPSHAKKVLPYNDPVPLFHRAGVESQLAALLSPVVNLRSGGYIVINPTEALVAIDVNSGRSTREYNIEETALKTNMEAAEEVARQLRLRDLAGLVVVDFIDMESNGNNRKVERVLKDALKQDRARIQVGRISSFGLLEMSRQRLRTGVLEASTQVCPMCEGSGLIRTDGSAALTALRMLEEEAVRGRASAFRLRADRSVAVYMLNRKRAELAELEVRYGVRIEVVPDDSLIGGRIVIDVSGPPPANAPRMSALAAPQAFVDDEPEEIEDDIEDDSYGDGAQDEDDDDRQARGSREPRPPREDRGDGAGRGRR